VIKTLVLRRKLRAYAEYCIAFKKLSTYEEFSSQVGMTPPNLHISKALANMVMEDVTMNRPLRASIFVRSPKLDQNNVIVTPSQPGSGYSECCNEHNLIQGVTATAFWKEELKKLGYTNADLTAKYGIIL
jgi:hypothetical protein